MERRDPYAIGQRVADLRRKKGLTQRELGDAVGIESASVSRIENGTYKNGPSDETVEALATVFGVTASYINYGHEGREAKPAVSAPDAVEEFLREEGGRVSPRVAENLRLIPYALLGAPSPTVHDVRRVRDLMELISTLAKKR